MEKKFKKFIDFLKVLDSGQELLVNDHRIVLGYTDDDIPKVTMVFKQYEGLDDEGKEVLLEPPLLQDLNNLIDYINNGLDDKHLEEGKLNMALNNTIKKRD